MAYQPGNDTYEAPEEGASVTTEQPGRRASARPARPSGSIASVDIKLADNGGVIVRSTTKPPARGRQMTGITEPGGQSEESVFGSYAEARPHIDRLFGFAEEQPTPEPAAPGAASMSTPAPLASSRTAQYGPE